ncbi:hypothetical protein F5890DRAFT_1474363 [Lentinula detonsa]|uniref:Uncharacterized protein n=1 Tax=Lentinula detonsa TaxID=2804962 RepID=A0AA38UUF5_9AGAR|nr:hypothetical protein F5890DRAFT_1474363 [Lentinula detonsa]
MYLNPAYLITGLISAAWATPLPAKHESSVSVLQSRAATKIVAQYSASVSGDPKGFRGLVKGFLERAARNSGITDPEICVPDNYNSGDRVKFTVTGFKECESECMGEVTLNGGGTLSKNNKLDTMPFYWYSPSLKKSNVDK